MAKQFPKARLVYGDLDSVDLITEESRNADIVCRKLPFGIMPRRRSYTHLATRDVLVMPLYLLDAFAFNPSNH